MKKQLAVAVAVILLGLYLRPIDAFGFIVAGFILIMVIREVRFQKRLRKKTQELDQVTADLLNEAARLNMLADSMANELSKTSEVLTRMERVEHLLTTLDPALTDARSSSYVLEVMRELSQLERTAEDFPEAKTARLIKAFAAAVSRKIKSLGFDNGPLSPS